MRFLRVAVSLLFFADILMSQSLWLEENFMRPGKGSSWKQTSGDWHVDSTGVQIQTKNYDQLLASSFYIYNLQPFSIEITLKGPRAGVFFSLDDTTTKVLSDMVRFDEKSILTGYFNGSGEFVATNSFDVPKAPSDWTVLRIEVDPKRKRYKVFADGVLAGVDDNLMFVSGFIGLQASEGTSQFKTLRVLGDSKMRKLSGPRKGSKISFQHVSLLRTEERNVSLFNPELNAWQTVNPDGKMIRLEKVKQRPKPSLRVSDGSRSYFIEGKKIVVRNQVGAVVDSIVERLITPSSIIIDLRKTTSSILVADVGANCVFRFDLKGTLLNTINGDAIGGFKALRGLDLYGEDGLVLADYDKVVFYNARTDSIKPTFLIHSPTEMEVTWTSSARLHSFVEYRIDGSDWKTLNRVSVHPSGSRTAILRNLQPLSRYSIRVSPTLNAIPEENAHSKLHRITTPPSDSLMMPLTRLPLLCMVYRTISYRDKYPREQFPQVPDGRTLSEGEVASLKKAVEFNREFYFRNSSCRLVLDVDFYVVDDTLWLHEVGDVDPYWLAPNERVTRDYETAVRHFGKQPKDYAGLICPYAWLNYPARRTSALRDPSKTDNISIRQAYGGGTNGVPAPWKYGTTTGYTGNPFQDLFSRQDWLITHEFHHQLDALMDASGFPEYYHADLPWKMPGRFGEDFDFNAHIIRNAPLDSWLNLKFGKLSQTPDVDHDGVPDDDPSLPFDEKRLGGNPHLKDTDGDGLSDLQEVMAGTSRGTALNNVDTDGDGLSDAVDPEPLYAANPAIKKLDRPENLQSTLFASLSATDMTAQTFLRWDEQYLYFKTNTNKAANLLLQIDADGDGWFHGFDNYQIRVMNNGDSSWVADYYLRDCSSWTESPKDRRDILKIANLQISSSLYVEKSPANRKVYSLTVKIPRDDSHGLALKNGKKLGIRIGLQTKTDLWVWNEMFERNYMMQIELQ
jgi:hypothetical protein